MSSWQTLDMIARADHARRTRNGEVAYAAAGWAVDRGDAPRASSGAWAWRSVTAIAGAPGIAGARTCCRVCCLATPGR